VSYQDVVKIHVVRMFELYPEKVDDVSRTSGLNLRSDGTNDADTPEDVTRYLNAVSTVIGPLVASTARLALFGESRRLGIKAKF